MEVINTEWGNMDMLHVMNLYDAQVDVASQAPTTQRFEKMVSGLYLGELCRVTVASPELTAGFSRPFASAFASAFAEHHSFTSAMMASIEEDETPTLAAADRALTAAGVSNSTLRDRVLLREACVSISTRAARLSAVGIAALLEQMGHTRGECVVAVDGTVFECYPFFKVRARSRRTTAPRRATAAAQRRHHGNRA